MAIGTLPNRSIGHGRHAGHDGRGAGAGGDHPSGDTPGGAIVPPRAYVTGITVALGAVLMFFMALVSAYIVRRDMPLSGWLPLAVFPRILWLDTLLLLASSFTLSRARRLLLAGRDSGFRFWWKITAGLGIAFLAGQLIAWRELAAAGVYLATNPSSSFFFVFTATHGLHILGGIAALLWVMFRRPRRLGLATATEVAAIYWHFMDGIWLFLFSLLLFAKA
ncbi:MAG TPA: cytochrome c oxidase subunit 3 [Candidatus Acidoferrales bacterium]|nr:cytochrome c oxidase subunit 3 [Candidatus Acidoferrales bacterium]